jgi:excisionase family DNA binding protein
MRSPVRPQDTWKGQGPDSSFGRTTAGKAAPGKPRFFTIDEVADCLNVSPRTVRRWIKSGDLPVHRFGRAVVRIAEHDLRAFLAQHRGG